MTDTRTTVWIALVCACLVVMLSMGMRQSFGIFMPAVSADLGGSREVFALAIALQNLAWGLVQPGVGMLADRYGSRLVAGAGGALYALGLALTTLATTAVALNLSLGFLVGAGLSATTFVVVLGAVAKVVPDNRRGFAFGIVTAAGSFGMFAMVPISHGLLDGMGWQGAFLGLTGLGIILALLAIGFPAAGHRPAPLRSEQSMTQALRQAAEHRGYWLLNAGFFVCGFHVMFIATHLPAYLEDEGLSGRVAAIALALIGLFNILGSFVFGVLGDRIRKPRLLSSLYAARVVVIAAFLIVPLSPATALVFSALMGFLWLGTIPLTSGLVAQIFGPRYMTTLFGIVFLNHQIGSFIGAWMGGRVFDVTGSYDMVWLLAVGLGIAATVLHLPISDRRVNAPAPA
ncbi:MFS transporter [Methylonatrum kenyense]|uniref:MFS transporter n=1 Tax=Methylonatrum kenyense TaxID=455253 RepID=UPI0031F4DC3C